MSERQPYQAAGPGRWLVLPLPRLSCPAAAHQLARRTDRRGVRRGQHAAQTARPTTSPIMSRWCSMPRARPSATTCSNTTKPTVRPCPTIWRPRSSRCMAIVRAMGLPCLQVPGGGGGRRHRHAGRARPRAGLRHADLHRRQGHGAAGRRPHHADQHHDQHASWTAPGSSKNSACRRSDHRLSRAGRRQRRTIFRACPRSARKPPRSG